MTMTNAPAAPRISAEPGGTLPPLACDLTAIADDERAPHLALAADLLGASVQECQELADGYAFRFAADEYPRVAAFIERERLCCAFFHFALEVSPAAGPLWLRITGPAEAKALLQSTLLPPQS